LRGEMNSMTEHAKAYVSSGELDHYYGKEVLVNRGGPDSVTGMLRKVGSDYMVLQVMKNNKNQPDEIVYIRTLHAKSVSLSAQNSEDAYDKDYTYMSGSDFNSVLKKLNHQFVQLNNNGPEKLDGFVVECGDDFMHIVSNREIVRISVFHVKSVRVSSQTVGYTGNGNNKNNNNDTSNNKDSNNKKNSDNRSSDDKSHGSKRSTRSGSSSRSHRPSKYGRTSTVKKSTSIRSQKK